MGTIHRKAKPGLLVLSKALFAVSLVVLVLATLSSTASAHSLSGPAPRRPARFTNAPCLGAGCFTKDPYYFANGACASSLHEISTTVTDSRGDNLATVYNDYSYLCYANFAQGKLSSYALSLHFTMVTSIATLSPPSEQQCYPDSCLNGYGGSAYAWTNMVDGYPKARAMVTVYAGTQIIGQNSIDQ